MSSATPLAQPLPTLAPLRWDPRGVLDVDDDGCCMGYEVPSSYKCRSLLADDDIYAADTLLDAMAMDEPDADMLQPRLHQLAAILLCRACHQKQANEVVASWQQDILAHVNSQRAHPEPALSQTSNTSSSASETIQETFAQMQDVLRATQRQLEALAQLRQNSPTLSRVATSDIPSLSLARMATDLSASTAASSSLPQTSRLPQSTGSMHTNYESNTGSCTRIHVQRRSIDGECPICQDEIFPQEQLVWCKTGCGRTVHESCFQSWEDECRQSGRSVTCGLCRAAWPPECGCV